MEAQKSLKEDWLLWLLMVGALVLLLGYYFLGLPGQQSTSGPVWVFSGVERDSITRLSVYRKGNEQFTMERRGGEWRLVHPPNITTHSLLVNNWINLLLGPELIDRFKTEGGADYGFDSPARRIEITQGDQTHSLFVGGEDTLGKGFYVRYGQGPEAPVFVLKKEQRNNFFPKLDELRRQDLFVRSSTQVQKIVMAAGGDTTAFERHQNGWRQTAPDSFVLSDTDVQPLQRGLRSFMFLSADDFYDTDVPDALRPYRARVKVQYTREEGGDTHTLHIGGIHNKKRLVKRGGWPPVAASEDPVKLFQGFPHKPAGWPEETAPASRPSMGGSMGSMRGGPSPRPPSPPSR